MARLCTKLEGTGHFYSEGLVGGEVYKVANGPHIRIIMYSFIILNTLLIFCSPLFIVAHSQATYSPISTYCLISIYSNGGLPRDNADQFGILAAGLTERDRDGGSNKIALFGTAGRQIQMVRL